jgi:hypothetical protein
MSNNERTMSCESTLVYPMTGLEFRGSLWENIKVPLKTTAVIQLPPTLPVFSKYRICIEFISFYNI